MVERDLLFEAQQAFYYGLPANKAIAALTSLAAGVIGMDHRIGMNHKWQKHSASLQWLNRL
jgi:imidazolonepropionase-like amidohydrolase